MKVICNVRSLAAAIIDTKAREQFLKRYPPDKYPGGIEMQTYERWTNQQQGKIFRDMGIAAKLLHCSPAAVRSLVENSPACKLHFETTERIGTEERGKDITRIKNLKEFTVTDCNELIPDMLEYLEHVIQSVYQERIVFNWSSRENHEKGRKFCEFTGESYENLQE